MQQRVKSAIDIAAAAGSGAPARVGFGRRMVAVLGAATANRGAKVGLVDTGSFAAAVGPSVRMDFRHPAPYRSLPDQHGSY